MPILSATGIDKRFGGVVALDGAEFSCEPGEIHALLGENGAGKSTMVKVLCGVHPPDAGTITYGGESVTFRGPSDAVAVGIVPVFQELSLVPDLTVAENLYIYGRYHDMKKTEINPRIDQLLEFAQLTERRNSPVEPLSGGMKRRLTIARALINDPDLIILDEPTTGLDPQARHLLWDRLYRLKQEGATLIITTHYMDEAEQLCDRLVVMDQGKIVAEGSPRELIQQYAPREVVELRFEDGVQDDAVLKMDGLASRSEVLADRVLLYTDDADATQDGLHARGIAPEQVLVRRSTLEDVFLRLTGRGLID